MLMTRWTNKGEVVIVLLQRRRRSHCDDCNDPIMRIAHAAAFQESSQFNEPSLTPTDSCIRRMKPPYTCRVVSRRWIQQQLTNKSCASLLQSREIRLLIPSSFFSLRCCCCCCACWYERENERCSQWHLDLAHSHPSFISTRLVSSRLHIAVSQQHSHHLASSLHKNLLFFFILFVVDVVVVAIVVGGGVTFIVAYRLKKKKKDQTEAAVIQHQSSPFATRHATAAAAADDDYDPILFKTSHDRHRYVTSFYVSFHPSSMYCCTLLQLCSSGSAAWNGMETAERVVSWLSLASRV